MRGDSGLCLWDRQCVKRHKPVIGERVVVNQEPALAREEGAGLGHVQVVKALIGVRADVFDADNAAKLA